MKGSAYALAAASPGDTLLGLHAGRTARFAALSPKRIATLEKLRRAAAQAAIANSYDAAAMASAPTITTSTSHSGTYSKTWPAVISSAPNTALFTFQGGAARVSTSSASAVVFPAFTVAPGSTGSLSAVYSTDATANSGLAAIEFVTDAPTFEVELDPYRQQAGVKVIVDGVYASKTPTLLTTGGATAFLTLAFGSRARRHIRVETADFFYGVRTTPIDTVSPAPTAPDAVKAVMLWDSYGVGGGLPSPTDLTIAIPLILAHRIGAKDMRAPAIGGTGMLVSVVSSVTYNTFRQRLPGMSTYSPSADVVFAPMSLNDVYSGFTSAQIAAEAALLYPAIRAAYPDAFIVATGVSPKNSGPAANYTGAEAAVAAAFSAWADPFSAFIPVATAASPWLTGTGTVAATNASGNCDVYLNSDAVHPAGEAGAAYYAGRLRDDYRRALTAASY